MQGTTTTIPTSLTIASSVAVRLRLASIHKLGARPLYELMCELSGSSAALGIL